MNTSSSADSMEKEQQQREHDNGDNHYADYDVLIGVHQKVIATINSDLHKILHEHVFKGSITIDTLGIKQIDYDIYGPPSIEFNQERRHQQELQQDHHQQHNKKQSI